MRRAAELLVAIPILAFAAWAILYGLGPLIGIAFVGWSIYAFHRFCEGRRLHPFIGLLGYMGTLFGSAALWAGLMWLVGLPAR